jgi:hypothetical protein
MKTEIIKVIKGNLTRYLELDAAINDSSTFLDILMNAGSETIVLSKEHFAPAFFDLKSGLAGDIFQKISNYQRRLIILGDFENIEKKSLRDFIYESNKTGKVIFEKTIEKAIEKLK